MREFFYGWRRKVGGVTLAMACVMMGLWARSHVVKDNYSFGSGNGDDREFQFFASSNTGFVWARESVPDGSRFQYSPGWDSRRYRDNESANFIDRLQPSLIEWRWRRFGFECGQYQHFDIEKITPKVSYWIVPYWSVILPLTLLSAYLILRTPRKRASDD
jgi:hypothetical protein